MNAERQQAVGALWLTRVVMTCKIHQHWVCIPHAAAWLLFCLCLHADDFSRILSQRFLNAGLPDLGKLAREVLTRVVTHMMPCCNEASICLV
jgi:hypothetical protein